MPLAQIPHFSAPASNEASEATTGLGRPMLFQVTRVGSLEPLWPYVLALHINPSSLQEQFTKSKNVVMTRGGFVEFVWPDDLDSLSADATTGAFIGPDSGLTADSANAGYKIGRGAGTVRSFRGRHGTIAWERHMDLVELFRQNGQIFNGSGMPILRSQIMCMYDRGVYIGFFSSFEIVETGDMPFQFKLSWEFKVTQTQYKIPGAASVEDANQEASSTPAPVASSRAAPEEEQFIANLGKNSQPVDPEVQAIRKPNAVQNAGSDAASYDFSAPVPSKGAT